MFRLGDTVVFDPSTFDPKHWEKESNFKKFKYYGKFIKEIYYNRSDNAVFDKSELKLLTFICEHHPQTGHCVLMDMHTGQLYPMCHANNFRLAEDEEC